MPLTKPNADTLAATREIEDIRAGRLPRQSMSVANFTKQVGK
jgi:hypothetical protein